MLCMVSPWSISVKGFTLIELMISIALLIIVFSVGIPGLATLVDKYQSSSATSSLKNILNQARRQALEKRTDITVCPVLHQQCVQSWDAPIAVFIDSNADQTIDAGESIVLQTQLNMSSGFWQKKRINTPYVRFSPNGHAFSTATTFLYCPYSEAGQYAKQIIINFQGRIRTENYLSRNGTPYASVSPLSCTM